MTALPVHCVPHGHPLEGGRDSGSRGCESRTLSRPRRASWLPSIRSLARRAKHWPLLTLGLALAALVASIPQLVPELETTRTGLAQGQWWRAISGHFTHWTVAHFAWDWVAFIALGVTLEARGRARLGALLLASAFSISAAVYAFAPDLTHYRGLSGLDSALFGLAWIVALQRAAEVRGFGSARAITLVLLGVGFAAKLAWELAFASALFMPADSPFVPVPLAHAVGAALGVGFGILPSQGRRSLSISRPSPGSECAPFA